MEDFYIGQVFTGADNVPEGVADWCNESGIAHLEEIDWQEGKPSEERRFQIVANAPFLETPEQIQARYTGMVQNALDAFARTRGYDGIMSACSYASSTDGQFRAEAEYCIRLRDRTWRKGYEVLDAVKSGAMPLPNEEAFLALLPVSAAQWPEQEL